MFVYLLVSLTWQPGQYSITRILSVVYSHSISGTSNKGFIDNFSFITLIHNKWKLSSNGRRGGRGVRMFFDDRMGLGEGQNSEKNDSLKKNLEKYAPLKYFI